MKRGPKPKPKNERQSVMLHALCTPDEAKVIRSNATKANQHVSAFLRTRGLSA